MSESAPSPEAEFQQLMLDYFGDLLSLQQQERLADLLTQNPGFLEAFREQLQLDYALRKTFLDMPLSSAQFMAATQAKLEDQEAFLSQTMARLSHAESDPERLAWFQLGAWGAAAAACLAFLLFLGTTVLRPAGIGYVAELNGDLRAADKLILNGVPIGMHHYTLSQGTAVIQLENGVSIALEAPSKFRLDSALLLHAEFGSYSVHVPPAGKFFTLQTPDHQIVDLGTEFQARIQRDHSLHLVVHDGLVEVAERSADKLEPPIQLTSGETYEVPEAGVPALIEKSVRFTSQQQAPTVDQADIAVLELRGAADAWELMDTKFSPYWDVGEFGHVWSDRPPQGQSFMTAEHANGYSLNAISLVAAMETDPRGSFTVYVGELQGERFLGRVKATAQAPERIASESFVTARFDSPIRLKPNTEYAFFWTADNRGFITKNQTSHSYSQGTALTLEENSQAEAQRFKVRMLDRVFHLDISPR